MAENITLELVDLGNTQNYNVIVGQAHFIKTVADVHEVMVNSVPRAQFGIAFCEASGSKLVRTSGTDDFLISEATRMAQAVGAGHSFVVVMKEMFPINVLPRLKEVPEVATIFCATANPVQVVVAVTAQGRGIMGVIDGYAPVGVETPQDVEARKALLVKLGYK